MTIDNASEDRKPRLIIQKLVLENFKSYAGVIEIGPFEKSFTAIVGPNGSGKSNVIDALLFVFGFKAKKMRQENLSGLVHKSAKYPDLEQCKAEVRFCEIYDTSDDGYEMVPGSELTVARTASVNNTSKYYLNGRTSSYSEITNLLKDKGIDLDHKRFLILQGEVEQIAQMKPKGQNDNDEGLLEYLEDIIGTSKYKEEIENNFQLFEQLNDRRTEQLNRVKVVETEVQNLEGDKAVAEKYLECEKNLKMSKKKLFKLNIIDLKEKLECQAQEKQEIESAIQSLNSVKGEEDNSRKETKAGYEKALSEFKETQKALQKAESVYQAADKEAIKHEEASKHLAQKKKKLQKQLEKDQNVISESKVWLKNHESDESKMEKELAAISDKLEVARQESAKICEKLKDKTGPVQVKLDAKKKELEPWMQKINAVKGQINVKQSEVDILTQEKTKYEQGAQDYKANKKRLEKELKEKEKYISSIDKVLEPKKKMRAETTKKLHDLKSLKEEMDYKSSQEKGKLQQVKISLEAADTQGDLIKHLNREKASRRLPGIYGRLSELGSIEEKFDVAISSSFKDKLQWIVVDSVETAEACLKILKEKRCGRASFVVLQKCGDVPDNVETPEKVPRLIDLIEPDQEELRKAFYHVVRETIVAKDLAQANRVAYGKKRWKTVTLCGKVIEKSGTITGGGNKVLKGAFKKSSKSTGDYTKNDLVTIENEVSDIEGKLSELTETLEETGEKASSLEKEVIQLESERLKAQTSLELMKNELASLQDSAVFDVDDYEKKVAVLYDEINSLKDEEINLKDNCASLKEEIAVLQTQLVNIGGTELKKVHAKVKDLDDEFNGTKDSLHRLRNEKKTTQKALDKATASIQKAQDELQEIEKELQSFDKTGNSSNDHLRQEVEKLSCLLEEKKEKLDSLKESLDEMLMKQNKFEKDFSQAKTKMQKIDSLAQEYQQRIVHYTKMLESMTEDNEMDVSTEEDEEMTLKSLETSVKRFEAELSKMNPNLAVLEEFKKLNEEYMGRLQELEKITLARDDIKKKYDNLKKQRHNEFMDGFRIISQKMKEMYQLITLGGNAELELVDSLDPFSEGILFSVMPPKKSWKNIANLSGGEKTLSSLALVFALHHYKPTPLYIMDEIDAALDFRNVSIIANYIKERTKNAQFVIISLRNDMFELATRLVGIYKTHNCTKSVSINVADYKHVLSQ